MGTPIHTVIFDWAGTTVDYGCFAPVSAFIASFEAFGITPTLSEVRAPMGLPKRDHVRHMLEGERIAGLWREKTGRSPNSTDIDAVYAHFEPALFAVLDDYAQPISGVIDTVNALRERGIAIGSTTGYTRAMMDVVVPLAALAGYSPDELVAPDDVQGFGRPYPFMIWENLRRLHAENSAGVIKIGDTIADIEEGLNAGVTSVGVILGSSELGLSQEEVDAIPPQELNERMSLVRMKYKNAGADEVLDSLCDLISLIDTFE